MAFYKEKWTINRRLRTSDLVGIWCSLNSKIYTIMKKYSNYSEIITLTMIFLIWIIYYISCPRLQEVCWIKNIKVLFCVWFIWRSVYHRFNYSKQRLKAENHDLNLPIQVKVIKYKILLIRKFWSQEIAFT